MAGTRPNLRDISNEYDYLVVGSSFAALGFIDQTLALDPNSRILCLERGDEDVEGYHQRLLEDARKRAGGIDSTLQEVGPSECSWRLVGPSNSSPGHLQYCAGTSFLFGGRSNYWHGWCVQPSNEQMRGFPQALLDASNAPWFWGDARKLLGVRSIEKIPEVFHLGLQNVLDDRLLGLSTVSTCIDCLQPACFAHADETAGGFSRFSVASRLRSLQDTRVTGKLDVWTEHIVLRLGFDEEERHVRNIETNNGPLDLTDSKTQVVLCAGAIPNAIILLNSLPRLHKQIGQKLSGHFRSHIFAKIPYNLFDPAEQGFDEQRESWGVAAKVICGQDQSTGHQFHIQLSAFHCPRYEGRYHEIVSDLPRYGTAPVEKHLEGLGDDILITCTVLGELDSENNDAWLRPNFSEDLTCNVDLQFSLTKKDHNLWNIMEKTAFQSIECLSSAKHAVEYWSQETMNWVRQKPTTDERRSPVLVHEACLTPVGTEGSGTLDEHFKVHGCDNVYVTGAGILPTAGSWNPTLAICGFSQHLARTLAESKSQRNATSEMK